jgi:hypothetical protein
VHIAAIPNDLYFAGCSIAPSVALWRGRREAAIVGGIQYVWVVGLTLSPWGVPLEADVATVADGLTLAACVYLALRSRAYWLIWLGSAAALSFLTDLLMLATPGLSHWAYVSALRCWSFVFYPVLLYGALARPRAVGRERSAFRLGWASADRRPPQPAVS